MLNAVWTVGSLDVHAGGTTQAVVGLTTELGRKGANISLVTQAGADFSTPLSQFVPPQTLVKTRMVAPDRYLITRWRASSFRATLKLLLDQKCQILHNNGLWLPINHASCSFARQHKIPLIISPHGMLEPWALSHSVFKKRIAWWFYQHLDLRSAQVLHATAEQEAINLRRLGFRQPIAIIPNGVDFATLDMVPRDISAGYEKKFDNNAYKTLLFLGRIHPVKGLLELVEAWGRIRPKGWRVTIAGPDEAGHRAELEAHIAHKGLTADFEFVGAVNGEEKVALYRSAELFVLPSFSENFGVVVAEALACGVPVVTTTGTPWKRLVTYRCGWWIDIGVDSLTVALNEAMSTSSEELKAMGERGRLHAVSTYGWSVIAEQMLDVYRWMLGEHKMPECIRLD
jgi:glycosyltransferase involved in cell wall biosynthesis